MKAKTSGDCSMRAPQMLLRCHGRRHQEWFLLCSFSFFFQLAVEHLSFHHPFICSISVLSLPVSRGLTFGYCCQTPDWMECLQCQQKCGVLFFWSVDDCKMGFFRGLGGSTLLVTQRQNLSYCLVEVVVVVKPLGIGVVRNVMTVFNYSQGFCFINDSFSTLRNYLWKTRNCSQCCCQMKRSEQI